MDGFDAYNTGTSGEDYNAVWINNGNQYVVNPGRYGGEAITPGRFGNNNAYRQVVAESTLIVGVAVQPQGNNIYFGFASTTGQPIGFWHLTGTTATLQLGGSLSSMPGGGTQVATVAVAVPAQNNWTYYELEMVSGTSGTLTLRANGVQVGAISGNTVIAGIGSLGSVLIGCSNDGIFDDLYVVDGTGTLNNTFLAPPNGDVRVATFFPAGAGADTQLTPNGAATNWQCVSEQRPDFDSTYVASATAGQEDLYAFTPALPTTNAVLAVGVKTLARKDDSTARSVASLLSSGVTIAQGATNLLGSQYLPYEDTYNTDPNTSAAWTVAAVNALQAGIKVIS